MGGEQALWLKMRGDHLYRTRDYAGAANAYDAALALRRANGEAASGLGVCLLRQVYIYRVPAAPSMNIVRLLRQIYVSGACCARYVYRMHAARGIFMIRLAI
jgi:hypothetical protein